MWRVVMFLTGVALLSSVAFWGAEVAHAQDRGEPVEDRSRFERTMGEAAAQASLGERLEVDRRPNTLSLSIGMIGFMQEGQRPGAPLGPGWALRYGYQPFEGIVGWEIAMVTGTSGAEADQVANMVILESGVKLSAAQTRIWSPLVALGLGYGYFAGPLQSDLGSLVIPVSVGVEGGTEEALFGLRAVWRPSVVGDRQVIPEATGHNTWQVVADLGVRF